MNKFIAILFITTLFYALYVSGSSAVTELEKGTTDAVKTKELELKVEQVNY